VTNAPKTIIAVTTEDDRHQNVLERAASLASQTRATVILYDLDADTGPFASPLPTAWSADGEREQFDDRLAPNDLEAAGRRALADQVRVVRAAGIEAFGWLPPRADAEAVAEYAASLRADLVLVSTADADLIDGLQSAAPETAGAEDTRGRQGTGRIRVEAVSPS
jgi:hypothetical protein